MVDYPYVTKTGTIKAFFAHIQSAGIPTKVDGPYIESVGFKSSNDRPIVGMLKYLGFVGQDGVPTTRWREYKDKERARKILGKALVEGYSELFETYPDAPRRDREALMNFFRTKTGLAERTVSAIVDSFKALTELADFEGLEELEEMEEAKEQPKERRTPAHRIVATPDAPTLSINIQLQLPATENQEIYDKLFASLRKHLFPSEKEN
jgi:hypothetical protein